MSVVPMPSANINCSVREPSTCIRYEVTGSIVASIFIRKVVDGLCPLLYRGSLPQTTSPHLLLPTCFTICTQQVASLDTFYSVSSFTVLI